MNWYDAHSIINLTSRSDATILRCGDGVGCGINNGWGNGDGCGNDERGVYAIGCSGDGWGDGDGSINGTGCGEGDDYGY